MLIPQDHIVRKVFVMSCLVGLLVVSGGITAALALVIPPLLDPPPGTTLTSSSITFTGDHTSQDLEHKLRIGTTNGGSQIYYQTMPPNHSVTVSGLPSTGTIYVWYWTRNSGGWWVKTYTYTMDVGRTWNCAAGDATCLINAITLANGSGNPEIIQLAAGIYSLENTIGNTSSLLPPITGNITILGAGQDQTIITSNLDPSRFFFRTFTVEENAVLNGSGFSIVKGGSGIWNKGIVTINEIIISENRLQGPGVLNDQTGTMTIKNSTVANNGGSQGAGGGIVNHGTVEIVGSTIRGNGQEYHGGIQNRGRMTIKASTVANNGASFSGGGIGNLEGAWLEISNSLIQNNSANHAGGIENLGKMTILRSVITGNEARVLFGNGGAIANSGVLEISRTVIANNTASGRGGGIINFGGGLSLDRTIIAGNEAGEDGGGVLDEVNGLISTQQTTITNNTPNDCAGCP